MPSTGMGFELATVVGASLAATAEVVGISPYAVAARDAPTELAGTGGEGGG